MSISSGTNDQYEDIMSEIIEDMQVTKYTFDRLLSCNNPDVISLYMFYYYTSKWQDERIIRATKHYCMEGLNIPKKRFEEAKKSLLSLDLIEDIVRKDKEHKITGHYILVKAWKSHPPKNPHYGSGHTMVFEHTNALRTGSLNSHITNKQNAGEPSIEKVECDSSQKPNNQLNSDNIEEQVSNSKETKTDNNHPTQKDIESNQVNNSIDATGSSPTNLSRSAAAAQKPRPKKQRTTRRGKGNNKFNQHTEEEENAFNLFVDAYPSRIGSNSRVDGLNSFCACLAYGDKAEDLVKYAARYKQFLIDTKKNNSEFVMVFKTFLDKRVWDGASWNKEASKVIDQVVRIDEEAEADIF